MQNRILFVICRKVGIWNTFHWNYLHFFSPFLKVCFFPIWLFMQISWLKVKFKLIKYVCAEFSSICCSGIQNRDLYQSIVIIEIKFCCYRLQEKISYKNKLFVFNLKDISSILNSILRLFLDKFNWIIQKKLPWSTISISYPGESYQLQSIACQQDTNITGSGNQSKMCAIKKNITWRSENKFSVSNKLFRLT